MKYSLGTFNNFCQGFKHQLSLESINDPKLYAFTSLAAYRPYLSFIKNRQPNVNHDEQELVWGSGVGRGGEGNNTCMVHLFLSKQLAFVFSASWRTSTQVLSYLRPFGLHNSISVGLL